MFLDIFHCFPVFCSNRRRMLKNTEINWDIVTAWFNISKQNYLYQKTKNNLKHKNYTAHSNFSRILESTEIIGNIGTNIAVQEVKVLTWNNSESQFVSPKWG